MKHFFNFAALALAMTACIFAGCKPDKGGEQEDTLEAFVKSIKITNAGISGGDMVTGEVDNVAMVITFNDVAAETNLSAIRFQATLSLGAALDKEQYDFTEGNAADATSLTSELKCINSTKVETYKVIINLKAPQSAPVIEKIVIKDDQGVEHTLTSSNVMDGLLCLGIPESSTATIVSVALSPVRSTYVFTTATDGVISASNPGAFQMDFMGLKAEYEVNFSASPTPGADFSQAVAHDFSVVSGNVYADLADELTRGGDFDGEYVLLANRTAPKLFRTEDLLNDNAGNPILLDITGIEGGVHMVSAGRLSHGHIYLCNLTTKCDGTEAAEGPLKVYHYASPTAKPEVVLAWDGSGLTNTENPYAGRIGDNISVNLDENGNGYVYFAKQEADNKMFRFTVTGFTTFSDPYEIELPAVCNYYGMYNQVGDNQYLFTSSYVAMMWLFDAQGTVLREFEWMPSASGADPSHSCDPRMITFNRSRYLCLNAAYRFGWWGTPSLYLYDLTEGNDVVSAMVKMQDAQDAETLEPCLMYTFPTETISSACTALCNMAERDGKLLIWAAAPHNGMVLIEVPKMK